MAIAEIDSVCTFDCPDTCSLTVDVDDGRIVEVRGSDAVPYTAGVICNKVARYMEDFVHGASAAAVSVAPHRAEGFRGVRAHLMGRGAGRDPSAGQRRNRPVGTAGGDAAELCRPARLARRRQHVVALLPPAGRHPALSAGPVRRRAQRGVGRDLRGRTRMPAGIRRARQAQRRLGQQRDGRQSAPRPEHQPREAQGRQAGGRRPAAHQDRRAGRSASAIAARHRHIARLVRRRRARTARRVGRQPLSPRTCSASRSSWRWRATGRRLGQRRPAGCRRARS